MQFFSALRRAYSNFPRSLAGDLGGLHRVKHRHSHAGCIQKSAETGETQALWCEAAMQELKCEPDRAFARWRLCC